MKTYQDGLKEMFNLLMQEANRAISTPGWEPTRGDVYRALMGVGVEKLTEEKVL